MFIYNKFVNKIYIINSNTILNDKLYCFSDNLNLIMLKTFYLD